MGGTPFSGKELRPRKACRSLAAHLLCALVKGLVTYSVG